MKFEVQETVLACGQSITWRTCDWCDCYIANQHKM